jgi:glycosyltransferase involved in cell wall biosynthesis
VKYLHVFPSLTRGGREVRAVELMAMTPPGTVHEAIALDGVHEALERVADGVRCEVLEPHVRGGLPRRMRRMRDFLAERRPDLILTYNWGSIEWLGAARWAGHRAVVHHEDGFGPDEAQRQLRRRIWGRRAFLRAAAAVIGPSLTLHDIARRVWRQSDDKVVYLPNGVDLARFRPRADRASGGAVVFGCVGRIRPEKNQALAVESLARMSDRTRARLRIVGDGPELDAVVALSRRLGIAERVAFVGNALDTAPEYRHLDAFLIPSRTEQMPLALLEAMASGLPVVGTDVGDVKQMVAEENRAWIVARGDSDALVAAMERLAGDAELRADLGRANRARAEAAFDVVKCYGRYVDLYARVAAGGAA